MGAESLRASCGIQGCPFLRPFERARSSGGRKLLKESWHNNSLRSTCDMRPILPGGPYAKLVSVRTCGDRFHGRNYAIRWSLFVHPSPETDPPFDRWRIGFAVGCVRIPKQTPGRYRPAAVMVDIGSLDDGCLTMAVVSSCRRLHLRLRTVPPPGPV